MRDRGAPIAGKPRSYRYRAALVGAKLARDEDAQDKGNFKGGLSYKS